MFRRNAARPGPGHRALYFLAFKEFTKSGDPHWHLLVDCNGRGATQLERLADKKWKSIVKSGTSDVQAIGATHADVQRVAEYVTKAVHLSMALDDFCISTEFGLPDFCGVTLP